jgi:hypothetical protein
MVWRFRLIYPALSVADPDFLDIMRVLLDVRGWKLRKIAGDLM